MSLDAQDSPELCSLHNFSMTRITRCSKVVLVRKLLDCRRGIMPIPASNDRDLSWLEKGDKALIYVVDSPSAILSPRRFAGSQSRTIAIDGRFCSLFHWPAGQRVFRLVRIWIICRRRRNRVASCNKNAGHTRDGIWKWDLPPCRVHRGTRLCLQIMH
jgi:hypothetical protein